MRAKDHHIIKNYGKEDGLLGPIPLDVLVHMEKDDLDCLMWYIYMSCDRVFIEIDLKDYFHLVDQWVSVSDDMTVSLIAYLLAYYPRCKMRSKRYEFLLRIQNQVKDECAQLNIEDALDVFESEIEKS